MASLIAFNPLGSFERRSDHARGVQPATSAAPAEDSTVPQLRSRRTPPGLPGTTLCTGPDLQGGQEGGQGPGALQEHLSSSGHQDAADIMPSSIELIAFLFQMLQSPKPPTDVSFRRSY